MTADVRLVRDLVATVDDREPLVVVIGDCILDRWTVGEAERVSREAPAPVVRVTETIAVPGGAANTAVNARALGARVRMVGLIGDDEAGDVLRQRLEAAGVDTSFLVEIPGARTTTKSRVVGGDRVVVRFDELAATPTAEHGERLARSVARAVRCADAAVVCDYGLGVRAGRMFAAYRAGEGSAMGDLVQALTPILWHTARATRLDAAAAEDVVQTVWLSLVRHGDTIVEPNAVLQ